MGKILRFAEYAFAVVALFILSGAVLTLVLSGGANQEDVGISYNTTLIRLSNLTIYATSLFLLAYRWKKSLVGLKNGLFVFSFIFLAILSASWSSEPSSTTKESISLIGSSLFGLYIGTRYSLKELLVILAWVSGISVILSFIFAIALPKYGLMGGIHAGIWRGVFMHKNGLGIRMVNSVMIFLILAFENHRFKWIPYTGILLSLILLVLAKSTSSLLNTALVIAAFAILHTIRLNYRLMVLALSILVCASSSVTIWFVSNAESIVNSFGKDLTLSGRTILWAAAWEMIQRKPWLGYGYGGFWNGLNGESAYIWLATGWQMTHPHNGFIGVLLDLGFVGLSIFLITYFQNIYRALVLIRIVDGAAVFYPILSLIILFATNLTETSLPFTSDMGCALYIFLSLVLPREIKKAKTSMLRLQSVQPSYSGG